MFNTIYKNILLGAGGDGGESSDRGFGSARRQDVSHPGYLPEPTGIGFIYYIYMNIYIYVYIYIYIYIHIYIYIYMYIIYICILYIYIYIYIYYSIILYISNVHIMYNTVSGSASAESRVGGYPPKPTGICILSYVLHTV